MNSETERVLKESRQIGIEFLLTELETGNILLDAAAVTAVECRCTRMLENARRACDLVSRLMGRLDLSPEEESDLQERLALLRQRLDSALRKRRPPPPAMRPS